MTTFFFLIFHSVVSYSSGILELGGLRQGRHNILSYSELYIFTLKESPIALTGIQPSFLLELPYFCDAQIWGNVKALVFRQ